MSTTPLPEPPRPTPVGRRVPDILDVIAQLSSDEVPTPPVLARAVLDQLPAEVWSNPDYAWLDPASKSGALLREVARRLMVGLSEWEPDPTARLEHIMRKMLHGCSITQLTGELTRRSVYVSRDATSEHSIVRFDDPQGNLPFVPTEHTFPVGKDGKASKPCEICGASPELERGETRENYAYAFIHGAYPTREMKDMRFDVIVGNPPYQMGVEDNTRAKPLYHLFVENALALDPRYLSMIIPSRWFSGGLGLEDFRKRMIADRHLKVIVDNPKVYDCFPGVKIRGGVNYFLWDREHDGDCDFSTRIDGKIVSTLTRDLRAGGNVVIRDNAAAAVIERVRSLGLPPLSKSIRPRLAFSERFRTNFRGTVEAESDGAIPIIHNQGVGYVTLNDLERGHELVAKWKVLIPKASSGDTAQDDTGRIVDVVLGEPIALAPGSVCTETYFVAGAFATGAEAENFAHFLATKFVRFLVLQRKTTQDVRPDVFRFVPFLDMNRQWSDDDLYKLFALTEEEISHVDASIKVRSVNLSLTSPVPDSHVPGGRKHRPAGSHVLEDDE